MHGEEESEQISHEIDIVIRHKVEELGSKVDLSASAICDLQKSLSEIPHRTYLWLRLIFNDLEQKVVPTKSDISEIARDIPKTVDEAYTDILNKSRDEGMARRLLHIVLAAVRPLTLQEMNVAILMDDRTESYQDLYFWPLDLAKDRIKNYCGLFLSVVDSKVYLIHQTAREFVVGGEDFRSSSVLQASFSADWKRSFHTAQSNLLLAEICILYLQLRELEDDKSTPFHTENEQVDIESESKKNYSVDFNMDTVRVKALEYREKYGFLF